MHLKAALCDLIFLSISLCNSNFSKNWIKKGFHRLPIIALPALRFFHFPLGKMPSLTVHYSTIDKVACPCAFSDNGEGISLTQMSLSLNSSLSAVSKLEPIKR